MMNFEIESEICSTIFSFNKISKKEKIWVEKDGYSTMEIANESDLQCIGTEIQKVCFAGGKYGHYHKIKTEFFYFTAGKGKAILGHKVIDLKPGVSFVVAPGVRHEIINTHDEPLEALMLKTNNSKHDIYVDQ